MRIPNAPTPKQWRNVPKELTEHYVEQASRFAYNLVEEGPRGATVAEEIRDSAFERIRHEFGFDMETGQPIDIPYKLRTFEERAIFADRVHMAQVLRDLAVEVGIGISKVESGEITQDGYFLTVLHYTLRFFEDRTANIVFRLIQWSDPNSDKGIENANAALMTYARTRVKPFPRVKNLLQSEEGKENAEQAYQERLYIAISTMTGNGINPELLSRIPENAASLVDLELRQDRPEQESTLTAEDIDTFNEGQAQFNDDIDRVIQRICDNSLLDDFFANQARVTPEQEQVIRLMDGDEYTETEAAASMDVPITTIRNWHTRGKTKAKAAAENSRKNNHPK